MILRSHSIRVPLARVRRRHGIRGGHTDHQFGGPSIRLTNSRRKVAISARNSLISPASG
jgi:hypothetical protein